MRSNSNVNLDKGGVSKVKYVFENIYYLYISKYILKTRETRIYLKEDSDKHLQRIGISISSEFLKFKICKKFF